MKKKGTFKLEYFHLFALYYSNDYEDMVPITQDGHPMNDIVVRPDSNAIYSSSPSGSSMEMPSYMDTTRQANFALALAQQSVLPRYVCASASEDFA